MIDTVALRLHDLHRHWFIVNQLKQYSDGFQVRMRSKEIPDAVRQTITEVMGERAAGNLTAEEALQHIVAAQQQEGNTYAAFLRWRNLEFSDTGRQLNLMYPGVYKIPSSSYELNFRIDDEKNYVHFEFSIPKLLYGHNLLQFVPHQLDPGFNFYVNSAWSGQVEQVMYRLRKFTRAFFQKLFVCNMRDAGGLVWALDFKCVEYRRVDLCWNQLFQTKEDKLATLQQQKQIRWKYARDTSRNRVDWHSSVMFVTDRGSFKIYDKGAEFEYNDARELKKVNEDRERRGEPQLDIEKMQSFADRILRYEMTMHNPGLSYVYQTRLFRKDCKQHRELKDHAKRGRRYQDAFFADQQEIASKAERNKRLREKLKEMTLFTREEINKMIKAYNLYERIENARRKFMLEVSSYDKTYNEVTQGYEFVGDELRLTANVRFTKTLMALLIKRFEEFIAHFQIKESVTVMVLQKKIREHNQRVELYNEAHPGVKKRQKIQEKKFQQFFSLLQQWPLQQLETMGFYSRETLWRYRKQMEALGVSVNAVSQVQIPSDHIFPVYDQDGKLVQQGKGFHWYYTEVMMGGYLDTRQVFV